LKRRGNENGAFEDKDPMLIFFAIQYGLSVDQRQNTEILAVHVEQVKTR